MALNFKVHTKNPEEMTKAFTKLKDGLGNHANRGVFSEFAQVSSNVFNVKIIYQFENRVSNWIIEKEFKSVLKKIDDKVIVTRIQSFGKVG